MRAKQANRAADCPMQTISRLFMMPQRRKQPGSGVWRIPDQDESRRFFFQLNRQRKRKENGWLHVLKKGARTAWDRAMGHAVLPQKNPPPRGGWLREGDFRVWHARPAGLGPKAFRLGGGPKRSPRVAIPGVSCLAGIPRSWHRRALSAHGNHALCPVGAAATPFMNSIGRPTDMAAIPSTILRTMRHWRGQRRCSAANEAGIRPDCRS